VRDGVRCVDEYEGVSEACAGSGLCEMPRPWRRRPVGVMSVLERRKAGFLSWLGDCCSCVRGGGDSMPWSRAS